MPTKSSLLLNIKNQQNLMTTSIEALQKTQLNHLGSGSVARLILAEVNKHIADLYQKLEISHIQAFLSFAEGDALDGIGELVNCERQTDETDENYKYRIHQQPLSLAKANETSIRLAILSVPEVRDVILKPFSHGSGSFTAYVVTDQIHVDEDILQNVTEQLDDMKAFGIRAEVLQPRLAPVEIRAKVLFNESLDGLERTSILDTITTTVRTHINELNPGDTLDMHTLRRSILDVDQAIIDIDIYHFTVKDKPVLVVDQVSAWNERFIEAENIQAISFT